MAAVSPIGQPLILIDIILLILKFDVFVNTFNHFISRRHSERRVSWILPFIERIYGKDARF